MLIEDDKKRNPSDFSCGSVVFVDSPSVRNLKIVSTDELQQDEGGFYAVLISSKNIHPQYTLEIKDSDLI
ncbi:MAG: hypothetical protein NC131_20045, partial [Roseburia sp.]|nr:hypothetical protein [Roseburia sp.]